MTLKPIKLSLTLGVVTTVLSACSTPNVKVESAPYQFNDAYKAQLTSVVNARSDDAKKRDNWRKPVETLAFFRVEPGMTVAEALPGGGWYTKIIADYLGADGTIYGINYDDDMWPKFGFFSPEQIKQQVESSAKFPETVAKVTSNGIDSDGFTFSSAPDLYKGTLDRVLVIRALHNLNRFENDGAYRTKALATMHDLLKSKGMVGVVQHKLQESADSEGAQGQRGYLKESEVIKSFTEAGFKLIDSSDMHFNPKDIPGPKDIVWRLPPTLLGAKENPKQAEAMKAIGESNRMTLLFQKR